MKDIKNVKCNNCGAHLSLDDNLKTLTCHYCGTVKYFEETSNPSTQLYQQELKVESSIKETYAPARPKLNFWLFILLTLCYFWPGFIYFLIVQARKSNWDKKYKK